MKRTETAGNPSDANRVKIKDPKFQTFTKITQMQDEEGSLAKRIIMLKEKQSQLNDEISTKEEIINTRRTAIIDMKRNSKKAQQGETIRRDVKNLQAKIDNLSQKGNEYVSLKKKLRVDINSLRQEKMLFTEILKKLKDELEQISNLESKAFKDQETALGILVSEQKVLQDLRQSSIVEQKRFGKEFQTVYKFFEEENQNERLNEKFPMRGKKQPDALKINEEQDEKQKSKMTQSVYGVDNSPSYSKKTKQLQERERKRLELTNNEKTLQDLKLEVEKFDNTFKQLMDETKTTQMNEILKTFADYEEENYGIFKYINELSDDLEHLQRIKRKLLENVEELEALPLKMKEDPKVQKQTLLTTEIESMKIRRVKYEKKYKDLMKIMVSLKVSIPIMFERIGCNQDEYMIMLGENFVSYFKDIDEDGIIKLLGVIERRTNDILQMQNDAQETRHGILNQQQNLLEPRNARMLEETNMSAINQQQQIKENDGQIHYITERIREDHEHNPDAKDKLLFSYKDLKEQAEKEWKKQAGKKVRK